MNLCLEIPHGFFILLSFRHAASSTSGAEPLAALHGDQLADVMLVAGGMQGAQAPTVPEGNVPREENGLRQKARCVTAAAPEEACCLHEAEGWRRFPHLVHAGSSMADV